MERENLDGHQAKSQGLYFPLASINVYTTCNLEHSSVTSSHPESDIRGKWPPCEYGLWGYGLSCHYPGFCCSVTSSFILKLCPHVCCSSVSPSVWFSLLPVFFHSFPLTCRFPAPPAPHPLVSVCVYSLCTSSCLCLFPPVFHPSVLQCYSIISLFDLMVCTSFLFLLFSLICTLGFCLFDSFWFSWILVFCIIQLLCNKARP